MEAGLNGESVTHLGTTTVVTAANTPDERTMRFAITGDTTEYVWLDYLTLDPDSSSSEPAIANGDFESLGAAKHGPLTNVNSWTIAGDSSVIGGMPNPPNYGFGGSGADNALYVGVDFVDGRSTAGKIHQDVGSTTLGETYTLSASVYNESWPTGYKLSLRDANTDAELAAVSDSTGQVSIDYTETRQRTLRVQVESNGTVNSGEARRTLLDDVALSVSGGAGVDPSVPPKPALADQVCPSPPGAPQGLTATPGRPGDGEFTFAWSAPHGAEPPVTDYEIRLYPEGVVGVWTPSSETTFTIRKLEIGLEQTFEVRARNSLGPGPVASIRVTPAGLGNRPPAFVNVPDLIVVRENSTLVTAIIAEDPDEEDAVTGYRLSGADGALFSIASDGTLSFDAPPDFEDPRDADKDHNYHVVVTAESGEGDRAKTATHSLTVFVEDVADNLANTAEVCFFDNSDWSTTGQRSGSGFSVCIGESAHNFNGQHNDRVSAVAVGADVHVVLYTDPGYSGVSKCIGSGVHDNALGSLDNAASSFKVIVGDCP